MTKRTTQPPEARHRVRLGTPSDLIEMIPYLLGFHPRESLVAVALRGDPPELRSTLRVDLTTVHGQPALPSTIARSMRHDGVEAAVAVVYGSAVVTNGAPPDRHLVRDFARALAAERIDLRHAMYVCGQRWWSYESAAPAGDPAGTPLPAAAGRTSTVATAATYAGLVALPDRDAVAAVLERGDGHDRDRLARALELSASAWSGVDNWREAAVETLRREVERQSAPEPDPLDDEQTARLLIALTDRTVRDACCEWASGSLADAANRLWCQLARRADPPYDVAPLTLVGWTAWRTGNGALGRIAVDRALASDPACVLALLLEEAMNRGLRPP